MERLTRLGAGTGAETAGTDSAGTDSGGVVVGWLVRITLILAVVGVLAFDGIAIGVAHLSAQDDASAAARVASAAYRETPSVQGAYEAALADAEQSNPANRVPPSSFAVAGDGTVGLTVQRTARTLVVRHLGWAQGWAEVSEPGHGRETS